MSQHVQDLRSSIAAAEDTLTLLQNKLSFLNAQDALTHPGHNTPGNGRREQKLRILALLRQLKTVPLKSTSSTTTAASLANTQLRAQTLQLSHPLSSDVIASQLFVNESISSMLDSLIESLNTALEELQSQPSFQQQPNEIKASALLVKTDALKERARTLSSYIKVLVNEYLFGLEFDFFFKDADEEFLKSRKQKFLKLLEVLLNNNILHPNSENPTWITLNSMDDPLVRFLLLNRIIVVHPTIPNKIMLKDLSVDL